MKWVSRSFSMKTWAEFAIVLPLVFFSACTRQPERLPDEQKYAEDSALLVSSSQKFADEPDVKKLHSIAMAMQTTRTLACIDYNDECTLFGRNLSLIIELTRKGTLTTEERKLIRSRAIDIRIAVEEGKKKLHSEVVKRYQSK